MPFIQDMLSGLQIQIDTLWYNLLLMLAALQWEALRAFIMMGYTIELLNQWLSQNAFVPLIQQANASLSVAVSVAFAVALLMLGITYLLASVIRLNVVELRSAILWYVAATLFFSFGPSFYQGMTDFRQSVANAFYLSALNGLQSNSGSAFSSLSSIQTSELGILTPCDNLGTYLPGATGPKGIDGLDVALAYLRADGIDVMGYYPPIRDLACQPHTPDPNTGQYTAGQIPWEWQRPGSFFDNTLQSSLYSILTDEQRAQSLQMASAAQGRLLTAWPLALLGVCEQLVYLLLTIAQGLTFLSFAVAVLFAFFKKTEVIARSIVDLWIELIIQTIVIALLQSLVVTFFLAGTAAGSGLVVLGIGLICLVFMVIVLWSGVKAVWNSFNRLFNAIGQATGGAVVSVETGAKAALAAGTAVVGGAVSLGAGALAGMTALNQGATPAQAAGIALGGWQALSGASRTLAYLPGVRGTSLGEAAEQFTEGAVTRQVARNIPLVGQAAGPLVGTALLTDRDPDAAQYDDYGRVLSRPMLVPAVGEALASWTTPRGGRPVQPVASDDAAMVDIGGEFVPVPGFTPLRPARMGMFTPAAPAAGESESSANDSEARSEYAAEMTGEEMEQQIADVMDASTGVGSPLEASVEESHEGGESAASLGQAAARLETSAEALANAARWPMLTGQMKVSGTNDVAGVLGDVIRQTQTERQTQGQPLNDGLDNLTAADRLARAMGVTPVAGERPPVQDNLARFGLFLDQALRLGVSGEQAEQVIQEVKTSPEGQMTETTRAALVEQFHNEQNRSWDNAQGEVDRLEQGARLLPNEITAFGQVMVPMVSAPGVPPEIVVQPQVSVQPEVTVQPNVNVRVEPPDKDYDQAMKEQSNLSGSDHVLGGIL